MILKQVENSKVAQSLRTQIDKAGERVWKFDDFKHSSKAAIAKELSRLVQKGKLKRISKGFYYSSKITPFGESKPSSADIRNILSKKKKFFPSGLSAANILGLSTQNPQVMEVSTLYSSLPSKLVGDNTKVYSRRPSLWSRLSQKEAAILDFLRTKGFSSDLKSEEIVAVLLKLLSQENTFERLLKVIHSEPPRVRAILGALGEQLDKPKELLEKLKNQLNPLSTFDFGKFYSLPNAVHWRAKKNK